MHKYYINKPTNTQLHTYFMDHACLLAYKGLCLCKGEQAGEFAENNMMLQTIDVKL